jgi:hypothetical protein
MKITGAAPGQLHVSNGFHVVALQIKVSVGLRLAHHLQGTRPRNAPDWFQRGEGLGNFMAYGDYPSGGVKRACHCSVS